LFRKPEEVCFVGDRLLTDVLLANINGSVSILVDELDPNSESIQIQIMRKLEKRYL
jgi:predicted HAD superfamily phosphohydrolase YqeG